MYFAATYVFTHLCLRTCGSKFRLRFWLDIAMQKFVKFSNRFFHTPAAINFNNEVRKNVLKMEKTVD